MIKADQPTIFGTGVAAGVSSIIDGSMKFGLGDDQTVAENRRDFLQSLGIDITQATLVPVTYDTDDFAKYRIVTEGEKGGGMAVINSHGSEADALVAVQPNHALFLPLADCVGVVIFDPSHSVLMVSHIGRHSAEITGGEKSIKYLQKHFSVDPKDVLVWLSPAVGNATYPLHKLGGQSLHDAITSQLVTAGVLPEHIEASSVDTASDDNYFSHSQHLKDASNPSGRFAVVAMIR